MSWPTPGLEDSGNGAFIRSQSVRDLPSSLLGLTPPLRALFSLAIITISGGSLPLKGGTDFCYCFWEMEEVSGLRYSSPLEILWRPRRVQCFQLLDSEAEVTRCRWRERILRNNCPLPLHEKMCILKSGQEMWILCFLGDSQRNQSTWFLLISQTGKIYQCFWNECSSGGPAQTNQTHQRQACEPKQPIYSYSDQISHQGLECLYSQLSILPPS